MVPVYAHARSSFISLNCQVLAFRLNICGWFVQELVAKPDQLIKRRGKLGLVKVKASLEEANDWVQERMGKPITVSFCGGGVGVSVCVCICVCVCACVRACMCE